MKNENPLISRKGNPSTPFQKILSWIAIGLGAIFFVTAVIGGIYNFTPVPFWDMWSGYIFFNVRILNGNYAAWWMQHVDHRLLVSNLLFWIDFRVFNGTLWFLIIVNYLLALAIWGALNSIASRLMHSEEFKKTRVLYSGVSLALTFAWIQKENFTWAFQSQMYTGILFPMLAFLFLFRSEMTNGWLTKLYFLLSVTAGVAAAGTMLNGLATLPLLLILGLLLHTSKIRLSVVLILAIMTIGAYLRGFAPTSSLVHSLQKQPLDIVIFFLAYVGAPAHYIFKGGLTAAVITGSIIIIGLTVGAVIALRKPIENKVIYVIFTISLYTILTCFTVAGSRISWGVEYAFTSRYMTNVLVLWGVLLLLLLYQCSMINRWKTGLFVVVLAIPTALLPWQLTALKKDGNFLTDRLVAALALELRVRDEILIKKIFPWNDRGQDYPWLNWAMSIVKIPTERNLAIFGNPIIRDAEKSLGTINQHHGIECVGGAETITTISGEPRFSRLSLWLMDPYTGRSPSAFYVMNGDRSVIGYGVSGYPRVGLAEDGEPINAGAAAYVLSDALNEKIILKGRDLNCEVTIQLPSARQFTPLSISDENWTNGVANNWGPALLFILNQPAREEIKINRKLSFSDGTVRVISKVEEKGDLVIVYVDGHNLNGESVGYPKIINVVP